MKSALSILLIIVFFLISGIISLPYRHVSAEDQYISLYPSSGPPGTTVQISGNCFSPSYYSDVPGAGGLLSGVNIYFGDDDVPVKTATTDLWGQFDSSFIIGACPAGDYLIRVCDDSDDTNICASTVFTVVPQLKLNKTSGYIGDSVNISATGFSPFSFVRLYYNGTIFQSATTDKNGGLDGLTIIIPEESSGENVFKAYDTRGCSASTGFSARRQRVLLSQSCCQAGDMIGVYGTGFKPGQNIICRLYNTDSVYILSGSGQIITDDTGNFTGAVSVPFCPTDIYIVEVCDGSNSASSTLEIKPVGGLDRLVGYTGTEVSFNGSGFLPDSTAVVCFDGVPIDEFITGNEGMMTAVFPIPVCVSGNHTVSITDGINARSFAFKVLPKARIEVDKEKASVGSGINIKGRGFFPDREVYISLDNIRLAETVVESDECFTSGFTIPVITTGNHTISVTDGINTLRAVLFIETHEPPAPALITPDALELNEAEINLFWEEIFDFSDVSYTLQISSDPAFSVHDIFIEINELTETKYTFSPDPDSLNSADITTYYWRVRTEDLASNIGDWSVIHSFSFLKVESPWTSYSLLTEVAALSGMFVFWIVRKKKRQDSE